MLFFGSEFGTISSFNPLTEIFEHYYLWFGEERILSAINNLLHTQDKKTLSRDNHQEVQQTEFIRILNHALEELYANSDTKIVDLAANVAMSERQLFRKLKSVVDLTPTEYIRRYRIEKARELLERGKTVHYAAFEVGFSSQSYFSRCFKAQFGCLPSEFKPDE